MSGAMSGGTKNAPKRRRPSSIRPRWTKAFEARARVEPRRRLAEAQVEPAAVPFDDDVGPPVRVRGPGEELRTGAVDDLARHRQRAEDQPVVVAQHRDVLAAAQRQAALPVLAHRQDPLAALVAHAARAALVDDALGLRTAAVVGDDDLVVVARLRGDGGERVAERGRPIARRNQDGESRRGHFGAIIGGGVVHFSNR
jgi:hypothetical protein